MCGFRGVFSALLCLWVVWGHVVPDATSTVVCTPATLSAGETAACTIAARKEAASVVAPASAFPVAVDPGGIGSISSIQPSVGTELRFVFTAGVVAANTTVTLGEGLFETAAAVTVLPPNERPLERKVYVFELKFDGEVATAESFCSDVVGAIVRTFDVLPGDVFVVSCNSAPATQSHLPALAAITRQIRGGGIRTSAGGRVAAEIAFVSQSSADQFAYALWARKLGKPSDLDKEDVFNSLNAFSSTSYREQRLTLCTDGAYRGACASGNGGASANAAAVVVPVAVFVLIVVAAVVCWRRKSPRQMLKTSSVQLQDTAV